MFEIELNSGKRKAEVSFWTAQIYESEFGGDIIKDFFGMQGNDDPVTLDENSEAVLAIDFTKINWAASMKVLWAALKTADDAMPSYQAWMRSTKGENLWAIRDQLAYEVFDCFFRTAAAGEEA